MQNELGRERLAVAGEMAGGVEGIGDLGVSVVVEKPVELGEGGGVGLIELPSPGRDRRGEARRLAAFEPDVKVDHVGLVEGDVLDEETDHALALSLGR